MIHELPNNHLAVEVPEGAHAFRMSDAGHSLFFSGLDANRFPIGGYAVDGLPEGNWQLIGKASELTEEQAAEIVQAIDCGGTLPEGYGGDYIEDVRYFDYFNRGFNYSTALESLASLFISKNLWFKTTVILKRI